ncbi:preprotein translocase subunit SecG [Emticicia fluvialis]|uniref:preprotein translocase subunit SecG n=1 Tax=Emticicia fluvialis TaxID=2974474 RepID=UPI0021656714|nr:preprotein translocase subunit SecG [Emticicia fluvialis]
MYTTILVLMVIVAILLVLIILIQNPKGGGISSEFSGAGSQMFGVQRTGDLLEQLTWGFFVFIIVGALVSGIFVDKTGADAQDNGLNVEKAQSRPATAPAPAPTQTPANTTPANTTPSQPQK